MLPWCQMAELAGGGPGELPESSFRTVHSTIPGHTLLLSWTNLEQCRELGNTGGVDWYDHFWAPPTKPGKLLPPRCGPQRPLCGAWTAAWSKCPKGLTTGHSSVLQRKVKKQLRTLHTPPWGKKTPFSPKLQGMRGHLHGARTAGSSPAKRDWRSPKQWSVSMQQRKMK